MLHADFHVNSLVNLREILSKMVASCRQATNPSHWGRNLRLMGHPLSIFEPSHDPHDLHVPHAQPGERLHFFNTLQNKYHMKVDQAVEPGTGNPRIPVGLGYIGMKRKSGVLKSMAPYGHFFFTNIPKSLSEFHQNQCPNQL